MFRFVVLMWDPAEHAQRAVARSLARDLETPGTGWRVAFDSDGMKVLCAGERAGSMQAYILHDGGGVVLGTLFARLQDDSSRPRITALRRDESMCIVASKGQALVEAYWGRYVAFICDPEDRRHRVMRDYMEIGRASCRERV